MAVLTTGAREKRGYAMARGLSSEAGFAPEAAMQYNKAIDTDAQGRPAAARLWPILVRRSSLR